MTRRTTKQHRRVTVIINGVSWGVFSTRTGGESSATVTKFRPGGMAGEETTSGQPTTSDVVVTRRMDLDSDHPKYLELKRQRLIGTAPMTVIDQPLDALGANYGEPDKFVGRLQTMTPPEADSNSSDPSMLSITMVVETA